MPFADISSFISCFIKVVGKRRNVTWKRNSIPITTALCSVNTCLQACPCRSANGLAGEVVFVLDPFLCKLAKVRRYFFIYRVPTLLVGKVEDNVFLSHKFFPFILGCKTYNCIVKINQRN